MWKRLPYFAIGLSSFVAAHVFAAPTIHSDRAAFLSAVGQSVTDTFSDYGASAGSSVVLNDAAMSLVKGETRFEPRSHLGINIVGDYRYRPGDYGYCSGCNGSFALVFENSTLAESGGVFGVAFDIVLHSSRRVSIGDGLPADPSFPSSLAVELVDGTSFQVPVPADVGYYGPETYFVGVTDRRGIRTIKVGIEPLALPHFWMIDNLTIAAPVPVPVPSVGALSVGGVILLSVLRRKRPYP